MAQAKTSFSHPLPIDSIVAPGGGLIGMTFCPGKKQAVAVTGPWDRDLGTDLDRIRDWGASAVVTFMEIHELVRCNVRHIGRAVRERQMAWHHLPIANLDVPGKAFDEAWVASGHDLRAALAAGDRILLHCRGGLGRTGTVAARLLAELGMPAEEAVRRVRKARAGTIETAGQEAYVLALVPGMDPDGFQRI
jgi:ADP-ribosyl-[dinitrogen reductase] hydrolase